MDSGWYALLFSGFGQGAFGVVLALVFRHYFRVYKRNYLRLWSLSFLALGVYAAAAACALYWAAEYPSSHPLRLSLAALSLTAVYPQLAWLMLGTWELGLRQPVRLRTERLLIAGLLVLGLISAFAFAFDPAAERARLIVRVGFRYALTGSAFVLAALTLLHTRVYRRSLGAQMVTASFALYGALLWFVLALFVHQMQIDAGVSWARALQVFDLLALALIGLGLTIWLLEEERARVDKAAATITRITYFDPLTGLPNRAMLRTSLSAELKQARVAGRPLALLYVDLDRFHLIADAYGARVADAVLIAVAERLRAELPPRGLLSRLDADKFAIVLPQEGANERPDLLAQRVLGVLKPKFAIEGREIDLSASIGIASAPDDALDADDLLADAERAALRLKGQGGGNYQFFARSMNEQARLRSEQLNEVRHGLEQSEFVLYYQPIVRAETKVVAGFEALARWRHPTRGVLGPEEFLPALGELNLLRDFDAWALRIAAQQIQRWRNELHPTLYVSVNISPLSFQSSDLISRVESVLKEFALPPAAIELEITETAALANLEIARTLLGKLTTIGVNVAIDDFGLGYASFNYLRMLPVRKVKLDHSSVRDLESDARNAAIVAALIPLAHSLNLEVVAEGVETRAQQDFLIERGVRWLQGFRYYRPMEPARCAQVLATDPGLRPNARVSP
jgi:diguanylate cyclase